MGTNKDNNSKIGNSNNENQIKNISNEKLIELKGVGVSFPPFVALEDISFDIFSTDYLGIIGRNGSGKTTLVRTILGLQTASSGSITIKNGIKMGYLPQIPAKRYKNFPANVNEIILSGFDKKTSKQIRKTQFEKATTRMNISHMLGKRIGDLSGGELQRVLLARTIISNPDILFLDEPTSALDPKIREQFYEIVDGLNKELGTAIVLISHDHSSICKHAKHIMELDKKIIFYGEACGFDHTMSHTMTGRSVTDIMPILPRESSAFFREEGQGDKQVGVELSSDQGTNTPGNNGKVSESRQFMGKMPLDNASVKEGRNGDY